MRQIMLALNISRKSVSDELQPLADWVVSSTGMQTREVGLVFEKNASILTLSPEDMSLTLEWLREVAAITSDDCMARMTLKHPQI